MHAMVTRFSEPATPDDMVEEVNAFLEQGRWRPDQIRVQFVPNAAGGAGLRAGAPDTCTAFVTHPAPSR
jgi:hypothetical protein